MTMLYLWPWTPLQVISDSFNIGETPDIGCNCSITNGQSRALQLSCVESKDDMFDGSAHELEFEAYDQCLARQVVLTLQAAKSMSSLLDCALLNC